MPLADLQHWLREQAAYRQVVTPNPATGERPVDWQPLSGDAGFRRYFRLLADGKPSGLMAVYAPPATENTPVYLAVSQLLRDGGVAVPAVPGADSARGFLLVEDCGDQLLLPLLDTTSADALYTPVLDMLLAMQAIAVPAGALPLYDEQRLWDEMALFPQWFVQDLLDLPFGRNEQALLDELFDWLIGSASEQPQVFVHRDYHARNLMQTAHGPVTIDFQDAVVGPLTYDLVSLLRDCYICWPPERVNQWALAYRKMLVDKGMSAGMDEQEFLRWFDLMGLQRHIKVLGIFARLWLRDGKAGYLDDLPLVLHYVLQVASRYPQAAEFVDWLQVRVLPACERQPWFRPLDSFPQ